MFHSTSREVKSLCIKRTGLSCDGDHVCGCVWWWFMCLQVTAGAHDSHGESTLCVRVCYCCVLGKSVFNRSWGGAATHTRMSCDLSLMQMSGDKSISAFPERDDLFKWIGTINGPQGTVSMCICVFYQPSRVLAVHSKFKWGMCETRCGGAIIAMSHLRQAEPFLCLYSRSSSYRILEFWSCRWSDLCQTLFSLNPLRFMMVFGTGCLWSSQLAIHIRLLVSNSSPHASIPTLMIKVSSVLTSWRTNGRRSTMCDPSFCPSRVCWEVKRFLYTKPGFFRWNLPSYSSWIIQTRKTTKICLMSQSPASKSCVLIFTQNRIMKVLWMSLLQSCGKTKRVGFHSNYSSQLHSLLNVTGRLCFYYMMKLYRLPPPPDLDEVWLHPPSCSHTSSLGLITLVFLPQI